MVTRKLYRMHDVFGGGMIETDPAVAEYWNREGFGIFWAVNEFSGARQQKNLVRINSWAIDMDSGRKGEMRDRLAEGLTPSLVVETVRGFHAYWDAVDGDPQFWNAIVLERLVPFYGADQNARDLCRVLRAPDYVHKKNPKEPFLVKVVQRNDIQYTQDQMLKFYPEKKPNKPAPNYDTSGVYKAVAEHNFWDNVYKMDGAYALTKFSGTQYVNKETYEFKKNANGNLNIIVNGNKTSCWIDSRGRIGSFDGGGPSIYQWLIWFGHSPSSAVKAIKEILPETIPANEGVKNVI